MMWGFLRVVKSREVVKGRAIIFETLRIANDINLIIRSNLSERFHRTQYIHIIQFSPRH